ncbi:MAG: flagellar basal-body rod protein FlgG [Deltaproteobacteria bacterium]|nr:flagellar basal-body rod protein FlgG [Deltaproteobacteria bacterium]
MMRLLYTAATGMEAMQQNIDVTSNNLANLNTNAFKKSRANFHDLIYQTLKAPGQNTTTGTVVPSGIQVGAGTRLSSVDKMFTTGAVKLTGNETDFMVEGQGFFRVQLEDGTTAYTRDGNFKWDNSGRLVTADGFPLVDEITRPQGATNLVVGMDGVVTVNVGAEKQDIGQIQLANFINPMGLASKGRNLYTATEASGEPVVGIANQNGMGALYHTQLEAANVNIVEEMVNMISGQRAYEMNSKVIQTGDQMLQATVAIR